MEARLILGGLLVIWGISAFFDLNFFRFIFPILLIWLGYRVITGRSGVAKTGKSKTDELNEVLIFSGTNKKIQSSDFNGGKVTVVFGSAEIDLSAVKATSKEIELELTSVFGGAKLIVPKTWKVKSDGVAVMGGFDNKAAQGKETTLILKGASVLGGIEVKN